MRCSSVPALSAQKTESREQQQSISPIPLPSPFPRWEKGEAPGLRPRCGGTGEQDRKCLLPAAESFHYSSPHKPEPPLPVRRFGWLGGGSLRCAPARGLRWAALSVVPRRAGSCSSRREFFFRGCLSCLFAFLLLLLLCLCGLLFAVLILLRCGWLLRRRPLLPFFAVSLFAFPVLAGCPPALSLFGLGLGVVRCSGFAPVLGALGLLCLLLLGCWGGCPLCWLLPRCVFPGSGLCGLSRFLGVGLPLAGCPCLGLSVLPCLSLLLCVRGWGFLPLPATSPKFKYYTFTDGRRDKPPRGKKQARTSRAPIGTAQAENALQPSQPWARSPKIATRSTEKKGTAARRRRSSLRFFAAVLSPHTPLRRCGGCCAPSEAPAAAPVRCGSVSRAVKGQDKRLRRP